MLKVVAEEGKFALYDGNIRMEVFETEKEAIKNKRYYGKADKINDELEIRLENLIDELSEYEDKEEFKEFLRSYFGSKIEVTLR